MADHSRGDAHATPFPDTLGASEGASKGAKGEEVRDAAPIEGVAPRQGQKGQKGFDQQWREESLKNVLQGESRGEATELG